MFQPITERGGVNAIAIDGNIAGENGVRTTEGPSLGYTGTTSRQSKYAPTPVITL